MCLVHQPNWIWTFKACLHITQMIAQHSFSVLRTFLSPLREWFTDDKRGTCVFGFHEWPRLLCNSKHIVNRFRFHSFPFPGKLAAIQSKGWFSHTIIWGVWEELVWNSEYLSQFRASGTQKHAFVELCPFISAELPAS